MQLSCNVCRSRPLHYDFPRVYGLYCRRCRTKLGDAFTLRLVGQRMTFLFDPATIETFFKAPDAQITFRPAVEQFTQRVFGLPSAEFFPKHFAILTALRHALVPAALEAHGSALAEHVAKQLAAAPPAGNIDLYDYVKRMVFAAATECLFGAPFVARHGIEMLQSNFFEFEAGFELAASPVPHILQPRFVRSRAALVAAFRASYAAGDFEGTVVGQLVEGCALHLPRVSMLTT